MMGFWALMLSLLFVVPCWAKEESAGQVINVNGGYQIAFTDLGNRSLKMGDLVKVSLEPEGFVYMEVIESSAILSKLGISRRDGFKTNLKDFQHVAVGNAVVKVTVQQEEPTPTKEKESVPAVDTTSQDILNLQQELNNARAQIQKLTESNKVLAEQVSQSSAKPLVCPPPPKEQCEQLKQTVKELKGRLEHINKTLSQNAQD